MKVKEESEKVGLKLSIHPTSHIKYQILIITQIASQQKEIMSHERRIAIDILNFCPDSKTKCIKLHAEVDIKAK